MNKNIDQNEIDKFSGLSSHWWDPNGELWTLHAINPLRLEWVNKNIPLNNKTVIDIGCGGGIFSESMAKLGAQVTAIDMSPGAINVAKLHQLESNIKVDYLLTTAEEIADQRLAQFDVVTCLEMLEHVPNPMSIINACATLTKPGGDIFFSTLNRNLRSYLFAIIGAEYLLKLLPKNTHDYAKFIKPSELSEWSRKVGLLPAKIAGIQYNPITKTFSINNDTSVNYLMHFKKV